MTRRRFAGGYRGGSGGHTVTPFRAASTAASTADVFFGFDPTALDPLDWWDHDTFNGTTVTDRGTAGEDISNTGTNRPTVDTVNGHTVARYTGDQALICANRALFRFLHHGTTRGWLAFYKRADSGHTDLGILGDTSPTRGVEFIDRDSQGDGGGQLRFYAYGSSQVVARVPHIDEIGPGDPDRNEAWVMRIEPDLFDRADFELGGPGAPIRAAGSRSVDRANEYDTDGWLIYNDTHAGPTEDADPDNYFCLGGAGAEATTGLPAAVGNAATGFYGLVGDVVIGEGDLGNLHALALLAWYYKRYALDHWLGGVFA